ncbi:hypothetical protein FLX56_16295 [Synechococcus moorigangaii CMS01]|nr:hypothetical protein [Synechococcus moorigangaii CMS01]
MKKPFLIIVGVGLALGIAGTGVLLATEKWLGQRLETDLEAELAVATGSEAAVGNARVQLLQQKVVFNDLALANGPEFAGDSVLQIRQIELTEPSLQGQPRQVAIAKLDGVRVNVEGDLGDLPDPRLLGALPNVNLAQLLEQLEKQAQLPASTDSNGQPMTTFTVDQLTVQDIQVNLNLTVPWQTEAIARTITVPDTTLSNVTNLNIGEKLSESLGPALTEELLSFFFEEILPGASPYAQELLPPDLDLSNLGLPENFPRPMTN